MLKVVVAEVRVAAAAAAAAADVTYEGHCVRHPAG